MSHCLAVALLSVEEEGIRYRVKGGRKKIPKPETEINLKPAT